MDTIFMNLHDLLRSELFSEIGTIDKDEKLYQEKNFSFRAQALDDLEFQVIDRINALRGSLEDIDQMNELKLYASQVKDKLEDVNSEMFREFRTKISRQDLRGRDLIDQMKEYLDGDLHSFSQQDPTGYDHLDLFLNGLMNHQDLPGETRVREPEMVYFQKTPGRIIFEMIRQADFKTQDVFFDLGSGLGQVVILVNLLTGVAAKGVEFEPAFCEYATNCATDLQLKDVQFINIDARHADYSSGTIFFMYTPFEGKMLRDVLENLKTAARNRKIKLFTYGPCTSEIAKQDWLLGTCTWQNGPGAFGEFHSVRPWFF